ncbi:MAG: NADH-quinone oxidoreductase subunit C [Bacteroidetes bacterium]|nr:NADH-quinone oxidoreductase subunit C [Bacteroidota bacterium]
MLSFSNLDVISLDAIPVLSYGTFLTTVLDHMKANDARHCVNYMGYRLPNGDLECFCVLADDSTSQLFVARYHLAASGTMALPSLSAHYRAFHIFERVLWENHGVQFTDHPWLKPVRYPHDAAHGATIDSYPFFRIEGGEVHEVGVGPIHAGVIKPGHFRFQCTGEDVVHLEIKLGYQHRGIERLMVHPSTMLQRTVLAESIAGDTTIGHTWAFVNAMQALMRGTVSDAVEIERAIALELERIAIHIGDLSALNLDVAYQLGSAVLGALRTPMINFFQWWCGNRFGKGLLRVGQNRSSLTPALQDQLVETLDDMERRYRPIADTMFELPSVLARFERTGIVTTEQAHIIGAVGMAARSSGLRRDVRRSHPHGVYRAEDVQTHVLHSGDVMARTYLRKLEIDASITYIRILLDRLRTASRDNGTLEDRPVRELAPRSMVVSMVEGWRGELVHTSITDEHGALVHHSVKDPSMHNWFALALSLRGNEISDFPICNKSYDLSYCGHDL